MLSKNSGQNAICPFCFVVLAGNGRQEYILEHIELAHREDDETSPFQVTEDTSVAPFDRRTRHARSAVPANNDRLLPGTPESTVPVRRDFHMTPSSDQESDYVICPRSCGEAIHIKEITFHMELHDIENFSLEETSHVNDIGDTFSRTAISDLAEFTERDESPVPNSALIATIDGSKESNSPQLSRSRRLKEHSRLNLKGLFSAEPSGKLEHRKQRTQPGVHRLGKAELGPYAFEEKMPAWLYRQLERGPKAIDRMEAGPDGSLVRIRGLANETSGIVPVLEQLCQQDRAISKVFLCHPSTKHIFKMAREGGFCGYRNIQMLVSFLQGTQYPGYHHFGPSTPSILQLQDIIEDAWDKNINSSGRVETGGIKGTRKFIGTPEAQALFYNLRIPCEANAFNVSSDTKCQTEHPYHHVLQTILEYFSSGVDNHLDKVYQTRLAPIYFQHPGHSLTIVGLEIRKSGRMNLLVFDPMFKTVPGVMKLVGLIFEASDPDRLLKAFRRGDSYLRKYDSFEILKLTNPLQEAVDRETSSEKDR